jgi:hypothetical protein
MNENIFLDSEIGAEISFDDDDYLDILARAEAACLSSSGSTDVAPEGATVVSNAGVSRSETKYVPIPPTQTLLETQRILHESGQTTLVRPHHIKTLVTNKLIIETEHRDPKVRLKALELLGKFTDVGIFTERKEIVQTSTADELRAKLQEKIRTLKKQADGTYS